MEASGSSPDQIPPSDWDEARCISALEHLEELQQQIDGLRLAIPRIIDPFAHNPSSPASLIHSFTNAAGAASKDLVAFKLAWQSDETKAIFTRAIESYKSNRDLSASTRTPKYGWTSQSRMPVTTAKTAEAKDDNDGRAVLDSKEKVLDIEQTLEEYRKAHAHHTVSTESNGKIINIRFKTSLLPLKFTITTALNDNGKEKLEVECLGNMPLFSAINRSMATRPHPEDLRYLLDMIASYEDVRKTPCAKCGKMVDEAGLTPAARRLQEAPDTEDAPEPKWQAFHEGCMP